MKLLDDIIDGAVDDKIALSTILRKCLVVADKLQNNKLRTWVLAELNGYPGKKNLPPYRMLRVHAVGLFVGSFNRQIADQPIPASALKEQHRDWASTAYMGQPLVAYETAVTAKDKHDDLIVEWPADLVAIYSSTFFEGDLLLYRAHQVIPRSSVAGIIDTVRNKLLEFALELRRQIGSEDPTPENPPPALVDRQVTNIIFGGTNVFGGNIAGDVSQTVTQTVVVGDFTSLSGALKQVGIPEDRLPALKEALDEDQKTGNVEGVGPKADGWVKSTLKGIGKTTLKVTENVASKVISQAILEYLGKGGPGIPL
jgi:hypothetical protein